MDIDRRSSNSPVPSLFEEGGISYRLTAGHTDEIKRNPYDDEDDISLTPSNAKRKRYKSWGKITILLVLWSIYTTMLAIYPETEYDEILLTIPADGQLDYFLMKDQSKQINILITAAFVVPGIDAKRFRAITLPETRMSFQLMRCESSVTISPKRIMYLQSDNWVEYAPLMALQQEFPVRHGGDSNSALNKSICLRIESTMKKSTAVQLITNLHAPRYVLGIVLTLLCITGFLLMILWHICDYTVAALVISSLSVGALAFNHMRPVLSEIMMWLQVDLLMLLFAIRLVTAVCADSGLFDVVVLYAYRFTNGHIWPMLHISMILTPFLSGLLGGVTTVLLLTPIHIRYCEALDLDPIPVLLMLILFSMTSSGIFPFETAITGPEYADPILAGINLSVYLSHIVPGLLIVLAYTYVHLRVRFIDSTKMQHEDAHLHRLQRVIRVYRHAAQQISGYTNDEQKIRDTLMTKVSRMRQRVHRIGKMPTPADDYNRKLEELTEAAAGRDRPLVYKCLIALILLLVTNTSRHWTDWCSLSTGWSTVCIVLLLFILTDIEEVEGLMSRIDWSPLLFIAAMGVYVEAVSQMGVHNYIAQLIANAVDKTSSQWRLPVAILLILWLSAIGSAFLIDSWVMRFLMPMVMAFAEVRGFDLPQQPLIWAMILGSAVGGCSTMIGGAANVACAGVAEKHGYFFDFIYFSKIAAPITLVNLVLMSIYLLICHVAFEWH